MAPHGDEAIETAVHERLSRLDGQLARDAAALAAEAEGARQIQALRRAADKVREELSRAAPSAEGNDR